MKKINYQGFTLIEVLVAATILAVLAAGAIVSYTSVNQKSRDSRRMSDVEQVRSYLRYRISPMLVNVMYLKYLDFLKEQEEKFFALKKR